MNVRDIIRKIIIGCIGILILVLSGFQFYQHRHMQEVVVLSDNVSQVKTLGDYFDKIKGTINDCNIYILEGEEPGGTLLVLGGSHPEEPAGRLASWIIAENAVMQQGRIIVVMSANRSGTTLTRPSGAYPASYTIPTEWGGQSFRMGDRWSNPLDQWPDPEVFIHYPSGHGRADQTEHLRRKPVLPL